eukprot:UN10504
MRSVFLCLVLLTLTLCIGHSMSDNKYNGINKYKERQFGVLNTRRLLNNPQKELRRERKKEARDKKHAKQETINVENSYQEFQHEMDRERGNERRENIENENQNIDNSAQEMATDNTENNSENTETLDIDANIGGKGKDKRISRYKFENGFANSKQNGEESNININGNDHAESSPAKSVPKTVFKQVGSFEVKKAYKMNQVWSKRTFWLLVC